MNGGYETSELTRALQFMVDLALIPSAYVAEQVEQGYVQVDSSKGDDGEVLGQEQIVADFDAGPGPAES